VYAARAALVALLVLSLAAPVAAHVPAFPADNGTPDRAVAVPDAAKSWSFYDRLDAGGARYYRLTLDAGDRLRVGAYTPTAGGPVPSVVLMSESLDGTDASPPGVTVPAGMGAVVVPGRPGAASYEPFAPSVTYRTVDVDRTIEAGGTYLVAVYDAGGRSGPVGVTVGYREAFSPAEYLRVPVDLVRVRLWTGQHPAVVAAPWVATAVGALVLALARRRPVPGDRRLLRAGLGVAGVLVLGTAASTLAWTVVALTATGPAAGALVTALLVAVPAVCGGWTVRLALRPDPVTAVATRVGLVVAAAASLATWAGFVVGPAAMLLAAAAPARTRTGGAAGDGRDADGAG
jgi:hypothetical protein